MIQTQEKKIGESNYMVTQMPALTAVRMQARLLKILGPSFAAFLASKESKSPDACLPTAVSLLAQNLDEKTFEDLVIDLMRGVKKDGVDLDRNKINMEFAGNLNDLFLVMQYVLEVNFSDFFQEGGIIFDLINLANQNATPPILKAN